MWTWRRNLILGLADHPVRTVAYSVAMFACGGVLFAVLMTLAIEPGGRVSLPAGREWQQALVDALGPAGYLVVLSIAMWAGLGVFISPWVYLLAFLSARQIRAKEAAAAALRG